MYIGMNGLRYQNYKNGKTEAERQKSSWYDWLIN